MHTHTHTHTHTSSDKAQIVASKQQTNLCTYTHIYTQLHTRTHMHASWNKAHVFASKQHILYTHTTSLYYLQSLLLVFTTAAGLRVNDTFSTHIHTHTRAYTHIRAHILAYARMYSHAYQQQQGACLFSRSLLYVLGLFSRSLLYVLGLFSMHTSSNKAHVSASHPLVCILKRPNTYKRDLLKRPNTYSHVFASHPLCVRSL
jgi:hypothetical protein